jgi:hypothetical protein
MRGRTTRGTLAALEHPEALWEELLEGADGALTTLMGEGEPLQRSYLDTYPVFLEFFQSAIPLSADHVIIGAALVYSWMPRAMRLDRTFAEPAAEAVSRACAAPDRLSREEVMPIAGLLCNSIVGASKLLHFAAPSELPIWDRRVAQALGWPGTLPNGLDCLEPYLAYVRGARRMIEYPESAEARALVNRHVGYAVTPLRALELLLYLNGRANGGPS